MPLTEPGRKTEEFGTESTEKSGWQSYRPQKKQSQDVDGSWKSLFFVVVFSWLRPYACHSGCFVDHSAGCGETTQGELFEVDADHNTLAGVPRLDWVTFWFRTFVSPLWEKRFLFLGYNSC